jgi:hypothetical protein
MNFAIAGQKDCAIVVMHGKLGAAMQHLNHLQVAFFLNSAQFNAYCQSS